MSGFREWFIQKHGFWPSQPDERVIDAMARMFETLAEYLDRGEPEQRLIDHRRIYRGTTEELMVKEIKE